MGKLRRREAAGPEDEDVLESVGEMILAANYVGNAQVGVIGARSKMIGWHAVGTEQGKIFDVSGQLHLFAVDRVGKPHQLPAVARYSKTQSKGLSRGGAPVTLRG